MRNLNCFQRTFGPLKGDVLESEKYLANEHTDKASCIKFLTHLISGTFDDNTKISVLDCDTM